MPTLDQKINEAIPIESDRAENQMILTDADNARTVSLRVGDKLVVHLEESPTTGFTRVPKQYSRAAAAEGFRLSASLRRGGRQQRAENTDVHRRAARGRAIAPQALARMEREFVGH